VCITDNGGLLRAQLPFGDPVWLFGSHDAYRRLTTHLAVSADHSHPQYPALSSIKRRRTADGERPVLAYSGLDGGEHAHHRRLVDRSFTERQVARLGEALGAVVDCELDAALGDTQPVDLAGGISIRLAVRCILLFLGVPLVSRTALGGVLAGLASPELTLHRREVLGHRLRAGVAAACAAEPGRQGSSWETLRHAYGPGPVFTEMTASLLIAGTETVARAICSGMLVVRGSSEAVDRLADSSADTGKTVDEILRLCGVADFVSMRVAVADFEMMGHRISRGDALVGLSALADRDASVFTSPARLDFHRAPRTVNAFGHGVHRCLGKHLARAVLGHTWKGLARRGALHRPLTVRWPDSGSRPLLYGPSVLTLA
jgi:cytochrome P450